MTKKTEDQKVDIRESLAKQINEGLLKFIPTSEKGNIDDYPLGKKLRKKHPEFLEHSVPFHESYQEVKYVPTVLFWHNGHEGSVDDTIGVEREIVDKYGIRTGKWVNYSQNIKQPTFEISRAHFYLVPLHSCGLNEEGKTLFAKSLGEITEEIKPEDIRQRLKHQGSEDWDKPWYNGEWKLKTVKDLYRMLVNPISSELEEGLIMESQLYFYPSFGAPLLAKIKPVFEQDPGFFTYPLHRLDGTPHLHDLNNRTSGKHSIAKSRIINVGKYLRRKRKEQKAMNEEQRGWF